MRSLLRLLFGLTMFGSVSLSAAGGASPTPTFIALGDSITSDISAPGQMWPNHLARLRGWTLVSNAAVSGATLSRGAGGQFPLVDSFRSSLPRGFGGHVILLAGTNDYKLEKVLGRAGETDPNTVYGALLTIGRGILSGTRATLHLCTPLWRGDAGQTEGTRRGSPAYTLQDVRQAVRYTAKRLASEFPGRVQLLDSGADLWYTMQSPGLMGPDRLHPTLAGQMALAEYLAGHLWEGRGPRPTTAPTSGAGGVVPRTPSPTKAQP